MFKAYVGWVEESFYGNKFESKHPVVFGIIYAAVLAAVVYGFVVD